MLSTRQKQLLAKLIESSQFMTVEFLAKWLEVSTKTIRNDLDALTSFLEGRGSSLKRTPGKGVLLLANSEEKEKIIESLELTDSFLDRNVQLTMISLYLLVHKKVTVQRIADEFFLSRTSVQHLLREVEELFDPFGLQISKEVRKGLFIYGTERSKRKAVFYWLTRQSTNLDTVSKWLAVNESEQTLAMEWMASCEQERGVMYSEESKQSLMIFFIWWKRRAEEQQMVFIPKKQRIKNPVTGSVSAYLAQLSGDQELLENELNFIHQIFDQIKVVKYKFEANDLDHYKKEYAFCRYLIDQISSILQVNLSADKKLMNDLMYHVKSAFLRIEEGTEIDNPYTEEIKIRFRAIYEMVHQITLDIGYRLIAAEVAYLTMHISSAMERSNNKRYFPNVIVICTTGLATSSILMTKLEHIEPGFNLLRVVNSQELEQELDLGEIDFILTTSKLPAQHTGNIKTYRVSPLLLDDEKAKIQHEAHKIVNRKQLKRFNEVYHQPTSVVPTLFDEQIHYRHTQDWHEAITIAAQPLLEAGYIKQGYIQEMIMSVERNGTYMVFLPKVAFVHAHPENVCKEGISMTIFEEEIMFGSKNPEQVKIIIVLAIKESHNQDFLQLYRYLENQEVLDQLMHVSKEKWRKKN
ncbi:BglG family transcription antiterminator [Gracilibacillus alcaliphilus]|uniref:BglG family transcription antiterminator n=1 Tax=Gracilibacillus alcaliphilus TaxID=1401441 RepID=UPI00195873B0|nr:PTS sugar transporter subunit IIA [Gracilibacillus alcaliphilus]MBM7677525.1 transcriptional antiterminator/mannitol/fructose-specific phosphotransferase system IIA component (Ntr-type) [Gracilibacillus alcaliphilus]